jgi:hypothetical protein
VLSLARPAALVAPAKIRNEGAMQPLDLHYSRSKLIRLVLMSLVGTAVGLWVALGGVSEETSRRGPGGWIGRMLGPDGVPILGWIVAAAAAAFALLYLRRIFGDPVAAHADAEGVTINTVFGRHFYAGGDVAQLELQFPAGQPILQVIPVPGRGKMRGLAVNGLAEDSGEVEAWIDAVHASLAGNASG